jgi:hypothetical protein
MPLFLAKGWRNFTYFLVLTTPPSLFDEESVGIETILI